MTTIAEYRIWRIEWRIDYKALSGDIRTNKQYVRELMRKGAYAGDYQYNLVKLKAEAKRTLQEYKEMKAIARKIWDLQAKEKGAD